MNSRISRTLLGIGILTLAFIGVLAGFYQYLSSPSGAQWVLSKVQSKMKDEKIEFSFQSARLALFSGISFSQVRISQSLPDQDFRATLDEFSLSYRIGFLARNVEIDSIRIINPKITYRSKGGTLDKPKPKDSSSTFNLEDFLKDPPLSLEIKSFLLSGLTLDFTQAQTTSENRPTEELQVQFADVNLKAKLGLQRAHGWLDAEFEQKGKNQIQLRTQSDSGASRLSFLMNQKAQVKLTLKKEGQQWKHFVEPFDYQLALHDISAQSEDPKSVSKKNLNLAQATLTVQMNSVASSSKPLALKPENFSSLKFIQKIETAPIQFVNEAGKKQTRAEIQRVEQTLTMARSHQFELDLRSTMKGITLPGVLPAPEDFSFQAGVALQGANTLQLLTGNAKMSDFGSFHFKMDPSEKSDPSLSGGLSIRPNARFEKLLSFFDVLPKTGLFGVEMSWTGKLKGPLPPLDQLSGQFVKESPLDLRFLAELKQVRAFSAGKPSAARFSPVHLEFDLKGTGERVEFKQKLTAQKLQWQAQSLLGLGLLTEGSWIQSKNKDAEPDRAKIHSQIRLAEEPALELNLVANTRAHEASGQLSMSGATRKNLAPYLPKGLLAQTGEIHFDYQTEFKVLSPKAKSQEMDMKGKLELSQRLPHPVPTTLVAILAAPVTLTHQVHLSDQAGQVDLEVSAPSLEIPRQLRIHGTQVKFNLKSPQLSEAKDLDFKIEAKQTSLTLLKELANQERLINGTQFSANGSLRNGDDFAIEDFFGEIGSNLVQFMGEVSGKMKTRDFQTVGTLTLNLPRDFPPLAGQTIRGRLDFPWTVSLLKGRDLTLEGSMDLADFEWSKKQLALQGMTGRFPIQERLRWDGKNLRFATLINQNAFERADYERLRPLIQDTDQISIDRIVYEDKTFGPFNGIFSVKQNMFFGHQFNLNLGSGRMYGEFFFNSYPTTLQFGLLSRLTSLKLEEVLPSRILTSAPKTDQRISARTALVININRGLMDGRIDVTEIDGKQLITLINLMDPEFKNEKMNKSRKALGIAYPTLVEMAFHGGSMDLGIQLAGALNTRLDQRGIPISSYVIDATSELAKKTEEGPLK
jgi:hypothetical protein